MKACYFFSNYYLSYITGQAGLMNKVAQETAKNSIDTYVISNGLEKKEFMNNNVHYVIHEGKGNIITYIRNLFPIVFQLSHIKPDIINTHGVLYTLYIWFINRLYNYTHYVTISESLDQFGSFTSRIFTYCIHRTKHIFVTSNFIKNQLINNGVSSDKITIIKIGLDKKFTIFKSKDERNYILYFGDANKERGFDKIVQLSKIMPNMKFLILLRKYEKNNILIKSTIESQNITTLYYPYRKSLISMISQAKLILLPFQWMSVRPPISIIESMALGKCTLTSNMKGNDEIVSNGENGYLCDFNKIESVVNLINNLHKNNHLRLKIGKRAKKDILKIYSNTEYSKILKIYSSI
ncbi:MAG: glycosyltransferase family 4 protein [Candidatus Roizmanbacteria bacterium]|nr:glycosyltransferase family 4 protein [Candidatus Roizmanbacteria bacterium]